MRATALLLMISLLWSCTEAESGPSDTPQKLPLSGEGSLGQPHYFVPDLEVCLAHSHLERCIDQLGMRHAEPCDSSAHPIPLVRRDPDYPEAAAKRGIEGWVTLSGTISPSGTVEDPVVVNSRPDGIFDREALRAFRDWRYCEVVHAGKVVKVTVVFPPH